MRPVARLLAIVWLCAVAPLELASALSALIGSPARRSAVDVAVIAMRIAVVAGGLVLGRGIVQRADGLRRAALLWAAADLGTLALVLASRTLPSSRAPGDAIVVWGAYLVAATLVVLAAPGPSRRGLDSAP